MYRSRRRWWWGLGWLVGWCGRRFTPLRPRRYDSLGRRFDVPTPAPLLAPLCLRVSLAKCKPQALQSVLAPSGPRRHSGVSARLQLWQRPGGAARPRRFLASGPAKPSLASPPPPISSEGAGGGGGGPCSAKALLCWLRCSAICCS